MHCSPIFETLNLLFEKPAPAASILDDMAARRRLQKEFEWIQGKDAPGGVAARPLGGDMFHWEAVITGDLASPHEGGHFLLDVKFEAEYPFKPPSLRFTSPMLHAGLDETGVLTSQIRTFWREWKPSQTLIDALR
eukprot:SAG11_NODE_11078_length_785_cov_1.086006_1_plen_134_part_01